MFRDIINNLQEWINRTDRKPLVLRGARQVGKTWTVRELAKLSNKQLIELNFERNPEAIDFFTTNDVNQIINEIETSLNITIDINNSLLFLDEIQSAPELLAKLRWFAEEMPQLAVIATGSLLEFALKDFQFSMPVGRINYMYLEPLSFEEFLLALGKNKMLSYLQNYQLSQEISLALHQQFIKLIKEYTLVGGLPAAVKTWAEHGSLAQVSQTHSDLLATYRDDFSKYNKTISERLINETLTATPKLLGNKIVYKNINQQERAAVIKKAIDALKCARIIHTVISTNGNLPLAAETNEKFFKAILLDTGITSALLGLNLTQLTSAEELILVNKGGIAEQLVGQLLRILSPSYIQPELFYWLKTNNNANGEIDYLIQHKHLVIPIEVKAGKTGTLKSLHAFMKNKNLKLAVRFNSDLPSKAAVNTKLTTGEPVSYKLLSLPFYLIEQLPRLLDAELE